MAYQSDLYSYLFPNQQPMPQAQPWATAPAGSTVTTGMPSQNSGGMNPLMMMALGNAGKKWGPGLYKAAQNYLAGPKPTVTDYSSPVYGLQPGSGANFYPTEAMGTDQYVAPAVDYGSPAFYQGEGRGLASFGGDTGSSAGQLAATDADAAYGMGGGLAEAGSTEGASAGASGVSSFGAGTVGSLAGSYLGANTGIRDTFGGDTSSGLSNFGQQAGSMAGSTVGGIFGGPPGAAAGGFLGSTFGGTYLDPIYDVLSLFG